MNTNGARASTAPGEQEPSPPEALRHLQQQIEELQAYFTHFVSAKIDGFLLSGRQIALWTVLGIMGLLALAGLGRDGGVVNRGSTTLIGLPSNSKHCFGRAIRRKITIRKGRKVRQ
jgi:hypothetical protein